MKSSRMACLALAMVLGATGVVIAEQPMADEADVKGLQGTWVLETLDGARPEQARSIRFEEDKVTGLFRDEQKHALALEFHLLSDRKIRGIDVGPFPPAYKGLVMRGIYDVEGDVLKLVFQPKLDARHQPPGYDSNEKRPTTFDPKLVQVQVWRRQKDKSRTDTGTGGAAKKDSEQKGAKEAKD